MCIYIYIFKYYTAYNYIHIAYHIIFHHFLYPIKYRHVFTSFSAYSNGFLHRIARLLSGTRPAPRWPSPQHQSCNPDVAAIFMFYIW